MLHHYLKIAFRNMWKYKTQTLIGIFGLAFGIACFVPAFYWLRYETTYDAFYPDARRIYRIYSIEKLSGKVNESVPGILEQKLYEHFPVTETSAAFVINYENYSVEETPHIRLRTLYADSTFFRVFPQIFIAGDARQPLQTARNIILTETVAIRLFGDVEKAIGQAIQTTTFRFQPYMVSAVVKDPPNNTNLSFEVIHFPEIQRMFTENMPEQSQWTYFDKKMYLKLNTHADVETFAEQLRDFTSRLDVNNKIELRILPIGDVRHRLDSNLQFTLGFIRLFIAAGLLLMFSAFFNFLNLYLGLFRQRIRELRLRTVNGASSWQLIVQMMFELLLSILLALSLSWCFVIISQPIFTKLLSISTDMPRLMQQFVLCGALVVVLMLLTAFFPLWRLSRLALRDMLKGKSAEQSALRNVAVAIQLSVSIVFIVAALVVMMQLRFVNRKDLGFDRHGIIQLSEINTMIGRAKRTTLMNELATIPQIENITEGSFEPQHDAHTYAMNTEVEWQGKQPYEKPAFQTITTDHRFAEAFRLKMLQGKWWSEGERQKIVLNEEAVRVMGLHDPIGAIIRMYPDYFIETGNVPILEYEVVGVVNDFHTLSLRSSIYPAIFRESFFGGGGMSSILYIRVVSGQEQEAIQRITTILPDIDVTLTSARLTSLNELYNRLNRSEHAGLKIFSVLATVCLLISLFGIYAVATASTRRRRKEIAIRKVAGAEVGDIARMFFRNYTLQVVIAGAFALPVAYLAMSRWLQGYAYHTNIPWWLLAGVVTAVAAVVLLTVLGQVMKAANSNPAEVLKSE